MAIWIVRPTGDRQTRLCKAGAVGPAMVAQVIGVSGINLGLLCMCGDKSALETSNIVPIRVVEHLGVSTGKRLGHIDTVKPHLVFVTVLVPEPAVSSSRLVGKLVDEIVNGQFVFGGSEVFIQNQEEIAGLDVVEDVVFLIVVAGLYAAVGINKSVNPILYELKI